MVVISAEQQNNNTSTRKPFHHRQSTHQLRFNKKIKNIKKIILIIKKEYMDFLHY